jgi:hypothetical protein
MLCTVATNKRRLEDADLDALWRPMPQPAAAAVAAGASTGDDDDF